MGQLGTCFFPFSSKNISQHKYDISLVTKCALVFGLLPILRTRLSDGVELLDLPVPILNLLILSRHRTVNHISRPSLTNGDLCRKKVLFPGILRILPCILGSSTCPNFLHSLLAEGAHLHGNHGFDQDSLLCSR